MAEPMNVVKTIRDAEQDAVSLSKFLNDADGVKVPRRLASTIDTLDYYIKYLNALRLVYSQQSGVVEVDGVQVKAITQAVNDAINAAAIEGNLVTDTLVTTVPAITGAAVRTQLEKNGENRSVFDFFTRAELDAFALQPNGFDATRAVQAAIDAMGTGGVLRVPLKGSEKLGISSTINITSMHKSLKIIGTRGTASRDSSPATFEWTGATNGGIMFDVLQSWGITFEDCSFNGADKATSIVRIRAEGDGLPVRSSHRFNFVRCGFGSTYNQLVVLGDGGNEDMINVKFDSCQFDYYHNATAACEAGILIDAPQGYCFDFTNCLFARGGFPNNFFHIKAGSVSVTSATFDGNVNSVDFFIDPYVGAISPQLTVTHVETQSDRFLKTNDSTIATRTVLLQNVRHRADNGQVKPMSIYWNLGGQSQLVHIACAFHGIEIGSNAASVVEIAPQWGRTGGSYPVTGYEGNLDVLTGLNGFHITEANRTIKGGLRTGKNFFVACKGDASGNPSNFQGFKIDGDSWLNTNAAEAQSGVALHQYVGTRKTLMGDSMVHQTFTTTIAPAADKFTYKLDLPVKPQINSIYEVRWSIRADNTQAIFEAGVFHIFIKRKGSIVKISKIDISLSQETPALISTGVIMWNGTAEVATGSASQAALDANNIRLLFDGLVSADTANNDIRISMRKIGH